MSYNREDMVGMPIEDQWKQDVEMRDARIMELERELAEARELLVSIKYTAAVLQPYLEEKIKQFTGKD